MEAKEFGRFIAGMRKEKKMTQAELAEKIHVTDKAVSRWERGLGLPDAGRCVPCRAASALGTAALTVAAEAAFRGPLLLGGGRGLHAERGVPAAAAA